MTNEMKQGPRLGEVLVQHNVISREHLTAALEEQQRTGRPLGEIIVERGFAPGPIVAQALATQYGGMVKTEYGYATGFETRANIQAAPAAAPIESGDPRDASIAELKRTVAARDAEIERLQDMIGQLRAQCVDAASAKTRLVAVEAELARLRAGALA